MDPSSTNSPRSDGDDAPEILQDAADGSKLSFERRSKNWQETAECNFEGKTQSSEGPEEVRGRSKEKSHRSPQKSGSKKCKSKVNSPEESKPEQFKSSQDNAVVRKTSGQDSFGKESTPGEDSKSFRGIQAMTVSADKPPISSTSDRIEALPKTTSSSKKGISKSRSQSEINCREKPPRSPQPGSKKEIAKSSSQSDISKKDPLKICPPINAIQKEKPSGSQEESVGSKKKKARKTSSQSGEASASSTPSPPPLTKARSDSQSGVSSEDQVRKDQPDTER